MTIHRVAAGAIMLFCFCVLSERADAQQKKDAQGREWWQNAVFYENLSAQLCG